MMERLSSVLTRVASHGLKVAMLCGGVLIGMAGASSDASAWERSRDWTGPRGGSAHWEGSGGPRYYHGELEVTGPKGRHYERETFAYRGERGVYVARRWEGPNGREHYRVWGRRR